MIVVLAHDHLLGARPGQDVSVAGAALGVFAIVAVPVLAGLAVRRWATALAARVEPACRQRRRQAEGLDLHSHRGAHAGWQIPASGAPAVFPASRASTRASSSAARVL